MSKETDYNVTMPANTCSGQEGAPFLAPDFAVRRIVVREDFHDGRRGFFAAGIGSGDTKAGSGQFESYPSGRRTG
ncbi:MAG: hypothetical protein HY315_08250 [Acidobacteria bacterium]|nr:hypothetical protein [Acidobacteriota bacterium]